MRCPPKRIKPTEGATGVAVDGSDNIVLVAASALPVNFGDGPIGGAGYLDYAYVAKFSKSGAYQWGQTLGGFAARVAVDSGGNVIAAARFYSAGGYYRFRVRRYDPSGSQLWNLEYGLTGAVPSWSHAVASGAGNTVYVAGGNYGGSYDAFVFALAPDGSAQWSKAFGQPGDQLPTHLAVDAGGNVLVTGRFQGTVDFGNGCPVTSAGGDDLFVAKYGPSGTALWARRFGAAGNEAGSGIAVEPNGKALAVGTFDGTFPLDGLPPLVSKGGADAFLVTLSP
jgi:hypothetical protein